MTLIFQAETDKYEEAYFGVGYSTEATPSFGTVVVVNNAEKQQYTAIKLGMPIQVCGYPAFETGFEGLYITFPSNTITRYVHSD